MQKVADPTRYYPTVDALKFRAVEGYQRLDLRRQSFHRPERHEKYEAGTSEDVRSRTTVSDGGNDQFDNFEALPRKLVQPPRRNT